MSKKVNNPILPRGRSDKTGTLDIERKAVAFLNKAITTIGRRLIDRYKAIPRTTLKVNNRYAYQIDGEMFDRIIASIGTELEALLFGKTGEFRFYDVYISTAYERGVTQQTRNLEQQMAGVRLSFVEAGATTVLADEQRLTRMALVRSRLFEDMQGLTQAVKRDLAITLSDAIGRGLGVTEATKRLQERIGVSRRRGERIARTEIPMALRRARWDETEVVAESYNLKSMEMHLSALSPTTRPEHAERNGKLYTVEQVREWWAEGANSINCKCSTTTVLVDAKGKPLAGDIVKSASGKIKFKR